MSSLRLLLLGPPRFERDGAPLEISRRKAMALLAYLAVTGESHRREELAAMLWPDHDESRAFAYLRRTLWSLKKALGDNWLIAEREHLDLVRTGDLWLDVAQFRQLLSETQTHGHTTDEICAACLNSLAEAEALYRDDFLTGFTLPDSPGFDEWQFFQAESLRQELASALERLVNGYSALGDFETAIPYARRWLSLDPLHEPAHQKSMQLYAWTGQQAAALWQYQQCVRILEEELGVPPSAETIALYEAIKQKRSLPQPTIDQSIPTGKNVVTQQRPKESTLAPEDSLPALESQDEAAETERPVFVARERELMQLNTYLDAALAGRGRIVFVTGEAGRGKTALLNEFAHRALEANAELIVASGNCNAYSGIGDPYLPFRDVMEILSGDIEAKRAGGVITQEHARRLGALMPQTVRALVDDGPDLLNVFVSAPALIRRATTRMSSQADWLEALKKAVGSRRRAETIDLEQSYLFEQFGQVLRRLASQRPLVVTLDDFQWADAASISLLFHLGRRLSDDRILIVGAYRPDEVALGRDGQRHPLEKVLAEFKRTYGDIQVDLTEADQIEGQAFVDAILDTQPNLLDAEFRRALFRQTEGHALFTVELLRAMQERGDLVQDEDGRWIVGPALDWQILPARVEGAIEERIGRLEPELRELLAVASVEGENFTAEVVAQLQQIDERQLLRKLSQELDRRHRLVREQDTIRVGQRLLARYQFAHFLFQRYFYHSLSGGERRYLHREVAQALETLYDDHTDEITMRLAHHYTEAGEREKAVTYLLQAGDQARRGVALEEAARFYRAALERWSEADQAGRAETLRKLGECLWVTGHIEAALETFEASYALFETLSDLEGAGATQRLIGRMYWEQGQRAQALQHYHEALAMLERGPESVELARSISAISQMHMLASENDQAIAWGERALALAERLEAEDVIVHALNNIGTSLLPSRDLERGLAMLQDSLRQALALGLPYDVGRAYLNTGEGLMGYCRYEEARTTLEALRIHAKRVGAPLFINIALIRLTELDWLSGHWSDALARRQQLVDSLESDQLQNDLNRVWAVTLLGWTYNDLGQAQAARQELVKELARARSADELQITVPHLGQLARALAVQGLEAEAAEIVREFLDFIDRSSYVHTQNTMPLLFACQWLATRSGGAARDCLDRLRRADAQIGSPETEAALSEGRGTVALAEDEILQAVEQFRYAVTRWAELGRPYDQLRALKGLGRALSQADDAAGARATFDQALGIVETLAAQLEEAELKGSFLNSVFVQEVRAARAALKNVG